MARKEPKLYEENDLAQLRLTKERADIRMFLNRLRADGKDVSLFMQDAIREKAGLKSSGASGNNEPVAAQPQITAELMEDLTSQIIERIQSQGLLVAPGDAQNDYKQEVKQEEVVVNKAVQQAIADALSWDED